MDFEARLKAYAEVVDARLDSLLPPAEQRPAKLHEAMRYSCLAPGKRLRPAICMASAEAVGSAGDDVLDAACAIEMVHCFSLIHDDLPAIDDDDLRRGRPTCHKVFGEAIAILAGDALFALGFETLARQPGEASRVNAALRLMARAAGSDGLVGGEVEDVLAEGAPADPARLQFIHSRKTGALFAAACEIGPLLGGGTDQQVASLREFGRCVGLAFQITDDLLNELSSVDALGKAAGSDRARSKATFPATHGIQAARDAANEAASQARADVAWASNAEILEQFADFAIQRLR